MNAEALRKLTDDELGQVIGLAQSELKDRAEKRRQDAIEEIKRIAGGANIQVTIGSNGKKPARAGLAPLKAGDRYENPGNAAEVYIVGKGRPPGWFEKLRGKGRLPMPEPIDNITIPAKANKAS